MRMRSLFCLLLSCVAASACSKADKDPKIFVPTILSPDGRNLDAIRAQLCNPKEVNVTENILTAENFRNIFKCANYDGSLSELSKLMNSPDFPELLRSLNLVLQSNSTRGLKETLESWLKDGPDGRSRIDRLLPFLSSMIGNKSFRDFLPVLSNILQAGKDVWNQLLPGLADVVYTELFPDNLENAFVVFSSFSGSAGSAKPEDTNHAANVKDFAGFLKSDVDGKTASLHGLELLNEIRHIELAGTSIYQFIEHMLEKGTISAFFLDAGAVRGEIVDPKLNESPDDPSVACAGLNESPEQRMQCAYERMFRRGAGGSDAPLTQLAQLVAEFQRDHPEFLSQLAAWYSANNGRVAKGLSGYVVRAQVVTNLSKFNVGRFLLAFAQKSGIAPGTKLRSEQLAELVRNAFASADFQPWLAEILPQINKEAFGERNGAFLRDSLLGNEIGALYASPELSAFAQVIIPAGTELPLQQAANKFSNKHRSDALQVTFKGSRQNLERHLGDLWIQEVRTKLGEEVVLDYVIKLSVNLVNDLASGFKTKNKSLSEWYFDSPYGNPATTELLVGYAIKELDLLGKYHKHKAWLLGDFANEAFSNDEDKRAFRMLVEQVPNIVLYVRSGMSRSGGDLTRAMARDKDGYLVRTYVNLIVKATETGWVKKGVRLIEAFQQRPGRLQRARAVVSDNIVDRRKTKLGVEALERIVRSLIIQESPGDYTSSTLGRLVTPLSAIVAEGRRFDTERFLLSSADQLLGLEDQKINDFLRDFDKARPPGSVNERREAYRSIADVMRNANCPELVRHLSNLFQENAIQPALDFFKKKYDDGSLPRLLLLIRRLLGYGT